MAVERSIQSFNRDVEHHEGYVYTTSERLSCRLSNQRMSDAVVGLADLTGRSVIDVGCGDGTYSAELLRRGASRVLGVDAAAGAIERASERFAEEKGLRFEVADASALDEDLGRFDVAVVRGLLHHLYDAESAIRGVCRLADEIVVLEPNGYSPALKLIERFSAYHRAHEEKSYPPHRLNAWFEACGGRIEARTWIGLVPFFCPDWLARICKAFEPMVEGTPVVRQLCCAQYVMKIRMG